MYGYVDVNRVNNETDYEAALCLYQMKSADFGLNVTGICDQATKELMSRPRCGCEDIVKPEFKIMPQTLLGPQEYNIGNTKWKKKVLTWTISKYPLRNRNIPNERVDDAMRRGLQIWADQTTLRFKQVPTGSPADINISFEVRRHTRNPPFYDFDGKGGVLAHAFFPESGVVHFDDDENFVLNSPDGTELYIVAAHEFGHTLGISHSNIQAALMAPYYRYSKNLKLHEDDIRAVQALYGRNTDPVTNPPITRRPTQRPTQRPTRRRTQRPTWRPVTRATTPRKRPPQCDMQIMASFKIHNVAYVFTVEREGWRKKTYVYKVYDGRGLDIGSRKPIEEMFLAHPSYKSRYRPYPYRVDAAVYINTREQRSKVFLFSSTRVYRYTLWSLQQDKFYIDSQDDYPKWFNAYRFPGRPRAASIMRYRGSTETMLLYSKTMFWFWDFDRQTINAWPYPLKTLGHTMPTGFTSAYSADSRTIYFIRGNRVFEFDLSSRPMGVSKNPATVSEKIFRGPCL